MHTDHVGATMVENVGKVVGDQPVVDRHEHGADLRHSIKRFEMAMGVRSNIDHTVAWLDAQCLQCRRPTVATLEKLPVGESQFSIDNSFTVAIQALRTPCELHRCQRYFHKRASCWL